MFTLFDGKGLGLLGLRPDELVGRSAFDVYHDYPEITEGFSKALSGSENSFQVEVSGIMFQAWVAPMKDEKGTIKGAFGVAIDSTELVKAKQDLEEAKSRAELYLDLLTHDITNYNTAAMGYLELAQLRLDPEKKEKLLNRPLQVLKHSSELIANVRSLRRVETGQDRTGPVDLCRMLRRSRKRSIARQEGTFSSSWTLRMVARW